MEETSRLMLHDFGGSKSTKHRVENDRPPAENGAHFGFLDIVYDVRNSRAGTAEEDEM